MTGPWSRRLKTRLGLGTRISQVWGYSHTRQRVHVADALWGMLSQDNVDGPGVVENRCNRTGVPPTFKFSVGIGSL